MFDAWSSYKSRFFEEAFQFNLSYTDKVLLGTLIIVLMLCGVSNSISRDIGSYEKLQLVKLEAQQETIALRGE